MWLHYLKVVKNFALSNKINITVTFILFAQAILAGKFWIMNLVSIIPPVFFTSLFIGLIIWNIVKKNLYGIIFILICIPCVIYLSDSTLKLFRDQKSTDSQTIKVFNWNTQFWEFENKREFYDFLLSQNADVYQLQEHIPSPDNGNFTELNDFFELQKEFEGYRIIQKTEFLTITKLPVIKSYESTDSYFLRVDVELGKNTLSLYNVHIPVHINPGLVNSPLEFLKDVENRFYFREEQFDLLLDDVRSNTNEYYISGDFNTTRSMGRIQEVLSLGKDASFAQNSLINGTWTIEGLKLWRIDYNILHRGLKVLSYTEINPQNFSDHWAQSVEFQL